jgi:hypothetical protein
MAQAAAPDNTPAVFASLDALLAAAVRVAAPGALLGALRCALSLRTEALQGEGGRLAAAGPARRLTLLFLHNALLARVTAALRAPKLAALLLPLVATDCPHMQCVQCSALMPPSACFHPAPCSALSLQFPRPLWPSRAAGVLTQLGACRAALGQWQFWLAKKS